MSHKIVQEETGVNNFIFIARHHKVIIKVFLDCLTSESTYEECIIKKIPYFTDCKKIYDSAVKHSKYLEEIKTTHGQ